MPTPDFAGSLPQPAEGWTSGISAHRHEPADLDMVLLEVVVDTRLGYEQDRRAQLRRRVGIVVAGVTGAVVLVVSGAAGLVLP